MGRGCQEVVMRTTPAIDRLIARATEDPSVLAVLVFGSVARGEQSLASDIDICLVLRPEVSEGMTEKRLEYLAQSDLDIHIFQQIPLPIRRRVLKEGCVLLSKDDDALYRFGVSDGAGVRGLQADL